MEDEDGNVTVTLELLHNDPMLSVPLLVADDLDDVAADWRAWADAYRLPMLLIEADGVARTLEESLGAAIRTMPPQERRKGRIHAAAPSAFPCRRRTGNLGLRLVVDGEEIIAPDLKRARAPTPVSSPSRARRRATQEKSAGRPCCSI